MTTDASSVHPPLDALLQRLGPTPDAAGDAYESLRRMLCRYFEVRGARDAAPLAPDRTVCLTVERASLTDGLYDVAVEGLDAQGTAEPLTLQQVRLTTTP